MSTTPKLLFLATACAAAATPALAQLKVAPPSDILAAVQACAAATSPGKVDPERLASDGWKQSDLRSPDGKSTETPLRFFSSAHGNRALVITMATEGLCLVGARIDSVSAASEVQTAVGSSFGVPARPQQPGETLWLTGTHVIDMELTGRPDEPSVRLAVMSRPERK